MKKQSLHVLISLFLCVLPKDYALAKITRYNNAILALLSISSHDLSEEKEMQIKGFAEGGQFEVLLKPSAIPATAPKCIKFIVLRMPWTDPDAKGANDEIAEKKDLYNDFERLRARKLDFIRVVIDLHAYSHVIKQTPLRVQMSQCNAFFYSLKGHILRNLPN